LAERPKPPVIPDNSVNLSGVSGFAISLEAAATLDVMTQDLGNFPVIEASGSSKAEPVQVRPSSIVMPGLDPGI
jgi:hypothetical protein